MTTIANIDINLRATTDQLDTGFAKGRSKTKQAVDEISQIQRMANVASPVTDVFSSQIRSLPVIGQVSDGFMHAAKAAGGFSAAGVAAGGAVAVALAGIVGSAMAASYAVGQIREQLDVIDQMSDRAKSLGMTFADLSTLNLSLGETSGLDSSAIEASIQKLELNLAEAATKDGPARQAFAKLGLDAADLMSRGPLEAIKEISEATQQLKNPTEQLAVSFDLFGKSGAMLVSSLREGAEAIEEMEAFATGFGLTLSEVQAEQVGALNDSFARLEGIATGVWRQIAAEAAPVLSVITVGIEDVSAAMAGWPNVASAVVSELVLAAGTAYDLFEAVDAVRVVMRQIASGDISNIDDTIRSAMTFDTGQKWLAEVNKQREAAAAASTKPEFGAMSGFEAGLESAKEAERIASEARKAEQDLLKEKERVAQAEANSRLNARDNLQQEINIMREIASQRLAGGKPDEKAIREMFAAGLDQFAGPFVENFKKLQEERTQLEKVTADLDKAKEIQDSLKTPFQKMQDEMKDVADLASKGLLSSREAGLAAVQLARDNLPGAAGAGASTLIQGTAEAYRKSVELDGKNDERKALRKLAEDQLKVAQDQLKELKNGGGRIAIVR
jgi:hypothetical protein